MMSQRSTSGRPAHARWATRARSTASMTSSAVQVGTSPIRVPSNGENDPCVERPGAAVTCLASRSTPARSADRDALARCSPSRTVLLATRGIVLGPTPGTVPCWYVGPTRRPPRPWPAPRRPGSDARGRQRLHGGDGRVIHHRGGGGNRPNRLGLRGGLTSPDDGRVGVVDEEERP